MLQTAEGLRLSTARVLSASTLTGDNVVNCQNEDLGNIEDLMIDLENGRIAYAALSFGGGADKGDKLFAIPGRTLRVDPVEKRFVLDVDKKKLELAPGFDRAKWPQMAARTFGVDMHKYHGAKPYWS